MADRDPPPGHRSTYDYSYSDGIAELQRQAEYMASVFDEHPELKRLSYPAGPSHRIFDKLRLKQFPKNAAFLTRMNRYEKAEKTLTVSAGWVQLLNAAGLDSIEKKHSFQLARALSGGSMTRSGVEDRRIRTSPSDVDGGRAEIRQSADEMYPVLTLIPTWIPVRVYNRRHNIWRITRYKQGYMMR